MASRGGQRSRVAEAARKAAGSVTGSPSPGAGPVGGGPARSLREELEAARQQVVARNEEDRDSFLRKRGFSKTEAAKTIETVLNEEGRPPESVFDFVQGITALARGKAHQDARLELEGKAKRLLEQAAA